MISRKLLLLFLALLVSQCLFAQTSPLTKGSYKLGGGFQFAYQDGENYETSELNLYPSFSYFISDNLLLGARLSYDYYHHKITTPYSSGESNSTSYGFGINGTYYIPMENFHPFIGATAFLNRYKDVSETFSTYSIEAGALFLFSKSAGFEPYLSYDWKTFNGATTKTFSVGLRFNYFIIN